ncbi:hypothetical protein QFZ75_007938 [Streptomyces sp. V3I8]|uniref:hypothetical protein n=1 Tax=Streptomyces sp. V3I8 TaxID=3042279 RepID=UPI002785C2F5|nr:hypothetical protein [Streptomyces sp. V3I8]MDQ1041436.1 hypothetical protein [Streptomyces sp. V3I8]
MDHETYRLDPQSAVADAEQWMARHQVDWGPAALTDHLNRFAIYASDGSIARPSRFSLRGRLHFLNSQPLFVAEVGDTLCWDGTRVQLHSTNRQGVQTCTSEEAPMLKFGTGAIIQDDEEGRIVRTAVALSEAERAGIIDEGEETEPEGE